MEKYKKKKQSARHPPLHSITYIVTMSSTLKSASQQVLNKTIQPTRTFFRVSENIPSIQHARAVFKTLGSYGDMAEYKVMRVSYICNDRSK